MWLPPGFLRAEIALKFQMGASAGEKNPTLTVATRCCLDLPNHRGDHISRTKVCNKKGHWLDSGQIISSPKALCEKPGHQSSLPLPVLVDLSTISTGTCCWGRTNLYSAHLLATCVQARGCASLPWGQPIISLVYEIVNSVLFFFKKRLGFFLNCFFNDNTLKYWIMFFFSSFSSPFFSSHCLFCCVVQ